MLNENTNILPKFSGAGCGPQETTKKKVLLLGSGLVASPAAQYITERNHELTIACRTFESAEKLAVGLKNATPMSVDVSSEDALRQAIKGHDVVVSLVPYTHHASVMKAALKEKAHVVTTSYVNPHMKALDQEFKDAGLICFNEIGVGKLPLSSAIRTRS
jgi:spermidine synthase